MVMATNPSGLLPSAKDFMKKIPVAEVEKASDEMRKHSAAEAEKAALLERLSKPWGVSDEEGIQRAVRIIERAGSNGLTEVLVHRFPNKPCTDSGRAITLTGRQKRSTSFDQNTSRTKDTSCGSRSSIFRVECPEMSE
jgi:hypothetical protein